MAPSTSKKTTAVKQKTTAKSVAQAKKKAGLQTKSSTWASTRASAPLSRQVSVEEVDDEEPSHHGRILDADRDHTMENEDEAEGMASNSNRANTPIELSDDESMEAAEESDESELSEYHFSARGMPT